MSRTESPLRYPGGKTQLYNFVEECLMINNVNDLYIEPFAGGAGLALKLLFNQKVNTIWINDYDYQVYSMWYAILNEPDKLIDLIEKTPFDYKKGHDINSKNSINFWKSEKQYYEKNKDKKYSADLAYSTLFLNRTNTSGIISGGPLGGYLQNKSTQLYARFNKTTLCNKIIKIHSFRNRIILTNYDGLKLIPKINREKVSDRTFIFFDPPYYNQGKKLYYSSFEDSDHRKLAKLILSLNDFHWITTYDDSDVIKKLYSTSKKKYKYFIRYSANNYRRGKAPELMFASPITEIPTLSQINLEKI